MDDPVEPTGVAPPDVEQILSIDVGRRGDSVLVTVVGEIDLMTDRRLSDALGEALDRDDAGPVLVVDLTGVTFMGSHGVAALITAAAKARASGRVLRVVAGDESGPPGRTLRLCGAEQFLEIHDSVDGAAGVPD